MSTHSKAIDPDDVKMCNCAECGAELLGESMRRPFSLGLLPPEWGKSRQVRFVEMRSGGRPYCLPCSSSKRLNRLLRGRRIGREGHGRWDGCRDNAVKALED